MAEQLPLDVIARLRALDSAITPELAQASWALLTPFHEKLGYTAPRIARDLRYGEHQRHRLDVHSTDDHGGAEPPGELAPVFLFVHGGGFVRGDKHTPGTPAYDLVGAWAVRHGWVGVNMTYRYAPEVTWPAGAQDVAAAVAWIRENIAGYGGDPDRIVVMGNSAGAVHAADFAAGHGGDLTGVRGAVLVSGTYGVRTMAPGEGPHPYYGVPDPAHASLPCLVESHVPLLFAVAERDPHRFHAAVTEAAVAWRARHGTVPDLVWIDGHNHMSAVGSLGVDEAALGVPLARFVEKVSVLSPGDNCTDRLRRRECLAAASNDSAPAGRDARSQAGDRDQRRGHDRDAAAGRGAAGAGGVRQHLAAGAVRAG